MFWNAVADLSFLLFENVSRQSEICSRPKLSISRDQALDPSMTLSPSFHTDGEPDAIGRNVETERLATHRGPRYAKIDA